MSLAARQKREKRMSFAKSYAARLVNIRNFITNRNRPESPHRHIAEYDAINRERQRTISQMTNWQFNQWGKAGRPMDTANLHRFIRLQRRQA